MHKGDESGGHVVADEAMGLDEVGHVVLEQLTVVVARVGHELGRLVGRYARPVLSAGEHLFELRGGRAQARHQRLFAQLAQERERALTGRSFYFVN